MNRPLRPLAALGLALTVAACQQPDQQKPILSTKSAVQLRAIQARAFETADCDLVLRTVVATMLDMGYTIDKIDPGSGSVSASKLAQLRLAASIYPRGNSRTIVRANAMIKVPGVVLQDSQVDAPEFYQKLFFEPLSKAMFLTALQVEDLADDHAAPEPAPATGAKVEPAKEPTAVPAPETAN